MSLERKGKATVKGKRKRDYSELESDAPSAEAEVEPEIEVLARNLKVPPSADASTSPASSSRPEASDIPWMTRSKRKKAAHATERPSDDVSPAASAITATAARDSLAPAHNTNGSHSPQPEKRGSKRKQPETSPPSAPAAVSAASSSDAGSSSSAPATHSPSKDPVADKPAKRQRIDEPLSSQVRRNNLAHSLTLTQDASRILDAVVEAKQKQTSLGDAFGPSSQPATASVQSQKATQEEREVPAGSRTLTPVLSPALRAFIGVDQCSPTEAAQKVLDYIKQHNLQSATDSKITCDDKLRALFETDRLISSDWVHLFLLKHFTQ